MDSSFHLQALHDILNGSRRNSESKSGSQSEETEDDDISSHTIEGRQENWLTESLPGLTHFAAILPQIYPLILRACLVETNLRALQGYLVFLTQYPPNDKLYQSAVELSRVMVDRFQTFSKLFTTNKENSITRLTAFRSVLSMFRRALQEVLESGTSPDLSVSNTLLLINFTSIGKKGILHMALIEAIFLVISCDVSHRNTLTDFKYFVELFFPSRSESEPEAFTVETKEPISLPPSSVLPQMLFSTDSKISNAVVSKATPPQLCTFVRQFGCSIDSVRNALKRLDECCEDQESAVTLRRAVEDPHKMADCIEVHFLRGIETGKAFHTYLQGLSDYPPSDLPTSVTAILEADSKRTRKYSLFSSTIETPVRFDTAAIVGLKKISSEKMEQYLLKLFTPALSELDLLVDDIRKEIETSLKKVIFSARKLTVSELKVSQDSINAEVSILVAGLHKLLTGGNVRRQFLEGMIKQRFSLSLLRMLTKIYSLIKMNPLFQFTIGQIMSLLESKRVVSMPGLKVFRSVVLGCAEQLGIEKKEHGASSEALPFSQLSSRVRNKCCEIRNSADPFEGEEGLIKMAADVVQSGSFALVEDILSTVAKRAIVFGMEARCIAFLHKMKTSCSTVQVPLTLQCFPERLAKTETETNGSVAMETDGQSMSMVVIGDLSGLFVDWLEILDPQVMF